MFVCEEGGRGGRDCRASDEKGLVDALAGPKGETGNYVPKC